MSTSPIQSVIKSKIESLILPIRGFLFSFFGPNRELEAITAQNAVIAKDLKAENAVIAKDLEAIMAENAVIAKDLEAISFRLGSMERQPEINYHDLKEWMDRIDSQISTRMQQLIQASDFERTDNASGFSFELLQGQNLKIPGTPLSVHKGPYGYFLLRSPDIVSDYIRAGGFWDEHLKAIIEKYGDEKGIAIDAGAYIGFHSCFMAKRFLKVLSFEPQKTIFAMLQANTLLNSANNVLLNNVALYDRNCRMKVADALDQEIPIPTSNNAIDYDRLTNAAALTFKISDSEDNTIPAITIDSLDLHDVRFIKIDTQGSDLKVLKGARKTIRRCQPAIVFEFEKELSKGHGDSFKNYESFFAQIGYAIALLRDHEGKQFDYLAVPKDKATR